MLATNTFLNVLLSVIVCVYLRTKPTKSHGYHHCHHAEQCQNQVFTFTNKSDPIVGIHCHGLATCYNSTIKSKIGLWSPYCDGSASCINLRQITTDTSNQSMLQWSCGGYYSCYNGFTSTEYQPNVGCSGVKSCSGSKTTIFSNYLQCSGLGSCMNTTIITGNDYITTGTILGYGMLSLYNSNIITMGLGITINIKFYGHLSGYKTNILCKSNDTCIIYCYSSMACVNLNIECQDGSNCGISDDDETVKYSDFIYRIFDENDKNDEMIVNAIDEFMYLIDDIDNITPDVYENYTLYYDELCYSNMCKGKYMCDNQTIMNTNNGDVDGHFCITGYSAGINSIIMAENSDIVVDGADSLVHNKFSANNIHCRGSDTCIGNITTNNGAGNVYCGGYGSCTGDDYTKWNDITSIYCGGRSSCDELILYGVLNIYAFGRYSLNDALIYSNGDSTNTQLINIYLSGENAGDGIIINCNGNDICTIYCIDTNLDCLDNIEYEFNCDTNAICQTKYYINQTSSSTSSSIETTKLEYDDDDSIQSIKPTLFLISIVGLITIMFC